MKVCCWSTQPHSELDCLRILPLLSVHLSRTGPAISVRKGTTSGTGGPHALTLSSAAAPDDDGRTLFVLSAWRAFTRPTVAEDREQYFGPKGAPDVRLECEWDAGDPEMERRALLRACAGVPVAELRAIGLRASAAVWSANDWYDTFVNCPEITHVLAHGALSESLLDALGPFAGTGTGIVTVTVTDSVTNTFTDTTTDTDSVTETDTESVTVTDTDDEDDDDYNSASNESHGVPLFQELVSLTLVGVDFVDVNETALSTLLDTMEWRQASPLCVTTLDRIELRACTIEEDEVDPLRAFASVVVWDSITDGPDDPLMGWVGEERDDDDDDDEAEAEAE